jgi:choline dehydrogenase-like flavoprotein
MRKEIVAMREAEVVVVATCLTKSESAPVRRARLLPRDCPRMAVSRMVRHYFHPVGTTRMGPAHDPGAVVDQRGRVHGISQLRVADASVMPTIPRANTNFPCIMIGERVAAWMVQESD